MRKCRFFTYHNLAMTHDGVKEFEKAEEGYFITLGHNGDRTMAFIEDGRGCIIEVPPDYVQFSSPINNELMDNLLYEIQMKIAPSKWPKIMDIIMSTFKKYG